MFIVSALLLDEALKPATALTKSDYDHQSHSHGHKILYKQTKLSKNTDQMPMTSVMMSTGTGRRKMYK